MNYLIVDEFSIYKAFSLTEEMREVVEGGMATIVDVKTMKYLVVSGEGDRWADVDESIY